MAEAKDGDGSADKVTAAASSDVKPAKSDGWAPAKEAPAASKADGASDSKASGAKPAATKKSADAEPVAPKKAAPAKKSAPKTKMAATKAPATTAKATPPSATKSRPASAKRVGVKSRVGRKPAAPTTKRSPAAKVAQSQAAAEQIKSLTVTELKEKIMATKTTEFTDTMSETMTQAVGEMQTKAQEAYAKTTTMISEMTEVAKGNVEAVVESGKIMAGGMQDLGKTYAEEAKSAYATMTTDMKEMAAVKSPTELFQLQGKIARRNFDSMIATSTKNTEAAIKLANDVFAPISGRMSVAVDKFSKVA